MLDKIVDFRWNAAKSFPLTSNSSGVLTCHYLSQLKTLNSNKALVLPKSVFKDSRTCKFCSNAWNEQSYHVNIKAKKNISASIRKILRRHERDPNSLRTYEKNFVKRFQANCNKLVLTCSVCSKKSELPLHHQKPLPVIIPKKPAVSSEQPKKKKKKRNKDRMCGLKMSLAEPRQKSIQTEPIPTEVKQKQNFTATKITKPKPNLNKAIAKHSPTLNQLPVNSKNKNTKTLNKNVLKNMISKSSIKHSLKDFLNSLP